MYRINKINKESKVASFVGKIINVILYIIIIPIIIFNFTLIIKSFINSEETPNFLGYKNFIIVSGSMEPTIMTGDAIFVKEVSQNEIKVNDIISFNQGGVITTHRIIDIVEDKGVKIYTTKGDNNNAEDKEKVTYEQIEGKYQFKINGFGKIVEILQSKVTLILLVLIIVINYWYGNKLENRKLERKEKRREFKQQKIDKM